MAARTFRVRSSSRPTSSTRLRALVPLAPLHQPHNLAAIDAVTARLPHVPQVACFDTSFHRGHSAVADLVPLPKEIRDAGVQRYGFHGLSYEYIASVLPQVAPNIAGGRVIVAHLGSGASLCALRKGKGIDSTLGFTALDGLCMGTRPGSIDPGVVLYLFQTLGLDAKAVETMLYKKSGLLGISGISNDMRDLIGNSRSGGASRRRLFRLSRRQGDRRACRGARRRRRHRVHRRYRRAFGADPPAHLRSVRVARPRDRSRRQRAPWTAHFHRGQQDRSVGRADQRRARHRPPHRTVAWLDREPAPSAGERRIHHDGDRSTNEEDQHQSKRRGKDFSRASGRPTSTSATSSSRTTPRMTATNRSSRPPRRGRSTSGVA